MLTIATPVLERQPHFFHVQVLDGFVDVRAVHVLVLHGGTSLGTAHLDRYVASDWNSLRLTSKLRSMKEMGEGGISFRERETGQQVLAEK